MDLKDLMNMKNKVEEGLEKMGGAKEVAALLAKEKNLPEAAKAILADLQKGDFNAAMKHLNELKDQNPELYAMVSKLMAEKMGK